MRHVIQFNVGKNALSLVQMQSSSSATINPNTDDSSSSCSSVPNIDQDGVVLDAKHELTSDPTTPQNPSRPGTGNLSSLTSRNKYILAMLCASDLVTGVNFSLPAPFYPRQAADKGVSLSLTGFILSSFPLAFCLSSLVFGNIIKKTGSTKLFYTAGLLVLGSCSIVFGFLHQMPTFASFVGLSFLTRLLEGAGMSAFFVSSSAVMIQDFPLQVSSVFAARHTCQGLGNIVGPAVGGLLYELGGFGLPFWTVGAITVCLGVCVSRWQPTASITAATTDPSTAGGGSEKGSMMSLMKSLRICVTLIIINSDRLAIAFLNVSLSQHLVKFGVSTTLVGFAFVVIFVSDALFVPLWGFLSDKRDLGAPVMAVGNLLEAVAFLFVGLSSLVPSLRNELWCVLLGLALFGVGFGMSTVPSMAQVMRGAKELGFSDNLTTFGLLSGIYVFFNSSGSFLGASSGGLLVEHLGFGYACTVIAGLFLLIFIASTVYFGTVYCLDMYSFRKGYNSF